MDYVTNSEGWICDNCKGLVPWNAPHNCSGFTYSFSTNKDSLELEYLRKILETLEKIEKKLK